MSSGTSKTLGLLITLLLATASFAAKNFDHAEYFKATATGQRKAGAPVKGTLVFDGQKKTIDFLDRKSALAFTVKYDAIKAILYEKAAKPRYTEAVLISPLFLLSNSKKHYLTIQFTDENGAAQNVIVRLDKSNAQEAVAAAESETGKTVERIEEK